MDGNIQAIVEIVEKQSALVKQIEQELSKVIVGQQYLINRLILGLISGGHILIEGVPGLAKTLAVRTLSDAVDCDFSRIQFTPDLLPADVIGTLIYNPKDSDFITKKGPVFTNLLLADEINRAPAKVQSALLEAMQEKQVTIGDETYNLPDLFMVIATQNPIEQEGTYPLPEAQVDRFMLKLKVGYPNKAEEIRIIERMAAIEQPKASVVLNPGQILGLKKTVFSIYMDEKIKHYIVSIIDATRHPDAYKLEEISPLIGYGASPRGTLNLAIGAKAYAFLKQRAFVLPDDVKAIAKDVLRHRLLLTYEAEAEGMDSDAVIDKLLAELPVP